MDLELNGKRAIVTGGSRGIGKAIARQLALEGVDVVISARNQEALRATAPDLDGIDVEGVVEPPLGAFELPMVGAGGWQVLGQVVPPAAGRARRG